MSECYLDTLDKSTCYGCEACVQICSKNAIEMQEDSEGFRYPHIKTELCISCGLCRKVCPHANAPQRYNEEKFVYGGFHSNAHIRNESTSGGAFSAIVETWCDSNYVIFGAVAEGLNVYHRYITDKRQLGLLRKSKYTQSKIGTAYTDAQLFLKQGRKVLFSGTPCQIAGLKAYLRQKQYPNLLTVEVVCEGVPTPLYIRKYDTYLQQRYGDSISEIDYRYTDSSTIKSADKITRGKWDFQVMYTTLCNGISLKKDRWFNPFWSIWLQHLISRPSCYTCPFATKSRNADITLGDLWGVHLYCPDLYGRNGGSSLVLCNSSSGKEAWKIAQSLMFGRPLNFETALKYQGPLRGHIAPNPHREECMHDLIVADYKTIIKKWAIKPGIKLLWQKYIWGNRQKIWLWNLLKTFNPK